MRRLYGVFGILVTLLFGLAVQAAPLNDNFSGATVISSTPFSDSVDTTTAATETTDPTTCDSLRTKSVWYRFTPPSSGTITADTFTSSYDTIVSAYTGSPGSFTEVACNNGTPQLQISFAGTAGVTYFFMVTAVGSTGGTLNFHLSASFPPSNDNYSSATVVSNTPFSNSVTTTAATTEAIDPATCDAVRAKSVWYKFTPTVSGAVTADTFTSSYDTILSAYTGSPGNFTQVACNDDAAGGLQSQASFSVTAGVTYSFLITSIAGTGGTLNFHMFTTAEAPPNDNYSSATLVSSTPFASSVDTTGATTQGTDPFPSCGESSRVKSVWYQFTPSSTATIIANTFTSGYDTILSVYTGSPGNFTQVACNDDSNNTLQSEITFTGTVGVTYFLLVTSFSGTGGTLNFHLFPASGGAPNDNFSNATVISSTPFSNFVDTAAATTEATDPITCDPVRARSVWYQYTPTLNVIITADTFTSSHDTTLSAYTGSPGSFTQVTCNNDAASTLQSQASFSGTPGLTYYFMITSFSGTGGTLNFHLSTVDQKEKKRPTDE